MVRSTFDKEMTFLIVAVAMKPLVFLDVFPSPCGSGSSTMEFWRSSRASEKVSLLFRRQEAEAGGRGQRQDAAEAGGERKRGGFSAK